MFVIRDGYSGPVVGHGNRWSTDKESVRQFATRREAEMYLAQGVSYAILAQVNSGLVIHELPDEPVAPGAVPVVTDA